MINQANVDNALQLLNDSNLDNLGSIIQIHFGDMCNYHDFNIIQDEEEQELTNDEKDILLNYNFKNPELKIICNLSYYGMLSDKYKHLNVDNYHNYKNAEFSFKATLRENATLKDLFNIFLTYPTCGFFDGLNKDEEGNYEICWGT